MFGPIGGISIAGLLVAGVLVGVPIAQAEGTAPPGTKVGSPVARASNPSVARGLIVRSNNARGLAAARAAVGVLPLGIRVTKTRPLASGASLLLFDRLVSTSEATFIAQALVSEGSVSHAEPDVRVHSTATPYIPNDTYFGELTGLWNGGGPSDYSIKAPLAWGQQRGSSQVVVAVIDSGVTPHPDLSANLVAGYDFVSDIPTANDGDARDPDPADPGDWVTEQETMTPYFEDCEASDSSWHGTHVAGTVAAIQNNSRGVTGVAPGVRVQPVRALGKCGGYLSDIADAIAWASGGSVPGVAANQTPADVLNLSLGEESPCLPGSLYQAAVSGAVSRGVIVVAAAGNESRPISEFSPAGCSGVIAVTAVDERGQIAGYSNYGIAAGQATIAAPGGDFEVDDGILSTANLGLTGPLPQGAEGAYLAYQGTSMAAPHVAGAAALVISSGVTDPARVRASLVGAVQPFPVRGDAWDCYVILCGSGILDLSRLDLEPRVAVPSAPTDVRVQASGATEVTVTWRAPASDGGAPITGYRVEGNANGGEWQALITTQTPGTSQQVTQIVAGVSYQFRVAAINSAGVGPLSTPSAPFVMPAGSPPGTVAGFSAGSFKKKGRNYQVTVRWQAPTNSGGLAISGYRVRVGTGSSWGSWVDLTQPSVLVTKLKPRTPYTLEVQASNAIGLGATASYAFTTPR